MAKRNVSSLVCITTVVLFLTAPAPAQTSLVSAALEGAVSDSSGARIPGVPVIVTDVSTNQARRVTTNAEGTFRVPELAPGTYEVTATHPGFAIYKHAGIAVQLGSTVHLDIVLKFENVSEQVTVSAQPPALDPAQTSMSAAVDKERIEELPVESRNYLNFALLAPGVAASAQQAGRQTAAPLPDSGFTFGGLRGRSNNVTVDGLDNNDEYVGSSRTELSLETVQEFQVINSGLSAETGGASGGSINVITRAGSNAFHGDAFVFVQDGSLDARNPFESEGARPDLRRYRTGFALGGPIVKDRTFFYAGFEQEHNRSLEDSFLSAAAAGEINSVLASGAYPGLATQRVTDALFPASRAETEASGKLNHQLTPRNGLMLRYAFTNNREAGDAFQTSGWTDPSARGSSFTKDGAVVGALTTLFDPASVGDLRFQFADRRAVLRTNDAVGPGVEIAGVAEFGRPYDGNGRRTERHEQAAYTYSHSAGRHLWKAGLTVNRIHENAVMADGFGGLYIFGGLADFAAGRFDEFRRAFGTAGTDYAVTTFGAFVTDHWTIGRKLAADFGVRYDIERLPAPFRQDANNVSPRVGLAYHAAPSWVLRAGYGIFFDRYVLASLNNALQLDGVHGFEQVLSGAGVSAAPSIYRADRGLATPYSQQTSFAAEHLLTRDLTASASYLFVRGVKLFRTRNVNLLPPGPVFGPGRADPRFNGIYQLESSASSTYQGLSFVLTERMSNELAFSAGYTVSKTYDNASDFDEQPQNPFDLASEWALSRQHQGQRLAFNMLWELPIGDAENGKPAGNGLLTRMFKNIEIAPIVTVDSGRPVDPLTGVDSNGSQAFPLSARPAGWGRNSLRSPMIANVDFRAVKFFPVAKVNESARLDLVAEAFNLLNRANVAQINPVFGTGAVPASGFLQPVTGAGARRIEFSLDFEF